MPEENSFVRFHSGQYQFKVPFTIQFGTQVKFRWSRDRNNGTAENAFSAPWYFSEMQLEPAAG